MRQHSFTFLPDDLACLAALIGTSWLYVAGETLTSQLNTPIDVIIGTTGGSIRLVSQISEADFEGSVETYAVLSVSKDVTGFAEAKRKGNVYTQHEHETIKDVRIIRDTVTEIDNGVPRWEYTTDTGVAFDLSGSAIAVVKGSHHTEMLLVRMGPSISQLDLPNRVTEWDDNLAVQHHSSRELIPLKELPGR